MSITLSSILTNNYLFENLSFLAICFIGPSETNLTETGAEKNVKPNLSTNIQDFVLLLKEKLEKPSLKKLICEIRAYKEQGTIDPLLTLLKEYSTQEVITNNDIEKFRPFVRKDDESSFNAIL